jgi:uncharacterized membrane protein
MRPAFGALILADALALLHARQLSSSLPAMVASHFDLVGRANGWMPRATFVGFYAVVVGLITLSFVGGGALIAAQPADKLKLPNREYWLAPERQEQSVAWIRAWMTWMAVVTVLLMLGVMRIVALFNADPTQNRGSDFRTALFVYLVATAAMVGALSFRFSKPKA